MSRAGIWLSVGLAVATAALVKAEGPLTGKRSQEVVEGWRERIGETEQLLREGKWKRSKRQMDDLLPEMTTRFFSEVGSGQLLGVATGLRAVAEAGLGDEDGAAWDWSVAKTLAPEVAEVDLTQFGEAGSFFSSPRFEELSYTWHGPFLGDTGPVDDSGDLAADRRFVPPKKRRAPRPQYPRGMQHACTEAPVVVQFVIDRGGTPRSPTWIAKANPVLFFAATESLRDWRFEPATVDGKPVKTYYTITVNYGLTGNC